MDTTPIQGIGTPGTNVLSRQGASFGENPFLELLVTGMRTQTPLDPVDNDSFMQQMASYSSMQEQRELNANLLDLLDFQGVLARLQGLGEGSALLGKDVEWTSREGIERSGRVDSVFVGEDGTVRVRVGEDEIDLRSITAIREPGSDGPEQGDSAS